jgi:uncharacterized protein involved in response to NO
LPTNPSSALTRWQVLTAAPHRMLFLGGALQLLAALVWWLVELGARVGLVVLPLALTVPPVWAHGFLMLYGIFPFFIFGFLFTVYPRWMGGPVIATRAYTTAFLLLAGGLLLFYAGLYAGHGVLAAALLLMLAGWGSALASLYRVYARARTRGSHERQLNAALAGGLVGIALFLVAVLTGAPLWFVLARETGLWLFLVPVVFLVAHRMVPVFSHSILVDYMMRRPDWAPPLMLIGAALHALLELVGLPQWRFLADLPLAVAALHLTWLWQFRRSFHARLLAMLHIAFLWLGIAMTLYAAQSLVLLATGTDYFGRAPLHALGIGFFAGMVVAMASRVTLGHSGRALLADTLTWTALLGVNLTAAARVAAEFVPPAHGWLNLVAALAWLAFLLPWVARYAPLYLRPRADGQPG